MFCVHRYIMNIFWTSNKHLNIEFMSCIHCNDGWSVYKPERTLDNGLDYRFWITTLISSPAPKSCSSIDWNALIKCQIFILNLNMPIRPSGMVLKSPQLTISLKLIMFRKICMLLKVWIVWSQPQYFISNEVVRNTPWRQVSSGTHCPPAETYAKHIWGQTAANLIDTKNVVSVTS